MTEAPYPAPSRRPRPVVVVRRLWLRLFAWRLLFTPLTPGLSRDPRLRDALERSDRGRCSVCGEVTADWEAEHSTPRGRGGADSLENMTTMCRVDHAIKTRAESRVRALSKRWSSRLRPRRPKPMTAVAIVLFAAGMLTTRWALWSLAAFLVLWIGPRYVRNKLMPKWLRGERRSGGIDGLSYWQRRDADREESMGGVIGPIARGFYGTRIGVISTRLAVMTVTGIYLAGVLTRAHGIDAAVLAVHVFTPLG